MSENSDQTKNTEKSLLNGFLTIYNITCLGTYLI